MTEEEGGGLPDPSGSFGSSPPNRNNNGGNSSSSRSSSSSSSSWKRFLGFSVMTLCLIQYWISVDYLMTSTTYYHDDSDVIYKMDLPTAQQQQQQHTTGDTTHNHNHKIMNYYLNITTPLPLPTLVHYDPHFLGGYRNQHMRFVSFINHAVTNSIPQILLPSLRWGVAQGIHAGIDAPFEYLFDVIYWNERAGEMGLPRLVRYDVTVLEGSKRRNNTTTTTNSDATIIIPTTPMIACFNTSSNLYSGLNEQLLRNPKTNIRKVNIWEEIGRLDGYSHCRQSSFPSIPSEQQQQQQQVNNDNDDDASDERFTYLIAHGGTKGAGRLWIEYYTMQRQRGKAEQTIHPITNRTITIHPEHHPVEKAINTILRPSEAIRNAIQSAILSSTAAATTTATMGDSAVRHDNNNINNNKQQQHHHQQQRLPKFLALHPRIEHDMLSHRCSKFMEQNLTKIFNHLKTKELLSSSSSSSSSSSNCNLLFLAINAELVLVPMADYDDASKKLNQQHSLDHVGQIELENSIVLNRTRMYGLFGNESSVGIPVFESGSRTAENILFPEEQHMDYYNTNSNNAAGNSTTIPPTPRLVSSESLGITSLVASIVNFFTIIEAESFVGVRGSSFSTDLFAVRYYMGKGGNYILSPEGIEELVGPPPSHSCG